MFGQCNYSVNNETKDDMQLAHVSLMLYDFGHEFSVGTRDRRATLHAATTTNVRSSGVLVTRPTHVCLSFPVYMYIFFFF